MQTPFPPLEVLELCRQHWILSIIWLSVGMLGIILDGLSITVLWPFGDIMYTRTAREAIGDVWQFLRSSWFNLFLGTPLFLIAHIGRTCYGPFMLIKGWWRYSTARCDEDYREKTGAIF